MPNSRLLVAAALCAAGCATASIPGQPLSMRAPATLSDRVPEFTRQGEIVYTPAGSSGSSAAWDARSVRGPAVNLTLTDEGLWGGTIQERAVLLRARNGRITGEGVDLFVNREGDTVHLQGLWFGRMVRVAVSPRALSATPFSGVCGLELAPADDGYWRGFGGCGGRLDLVWMKLKGVAADPPAEMPQWFFAFLGSLPSVNSSTVARGGGVAPGAYRPIGYFLGAEFRGPPPWSIPPPWQFSCSTVGGYPPCDPLLTASGMLRRPGGGFETYDTRPATVLARGAGSGAGQPGVTARTGGLARAPGMRPTNGGNTGPPVRAAAPPGVPRGGEDGSASGRAVASSSGRGSSRAPAP